MDLFISIFKISVRIGIGFILMLIAAEVILQCLPVKTGFVRPSVIETNTPPHWQPNQSFLYSVGWRLDNPQTGVINNKGYPTPVTFEDNAKAIIVIGDSFVENQMNSWDESFMGRLAKDAPFPVYAFGLSGAQAADYIGLTQYAATHYKPQHLILLLSDGDLTSATTPYQPGHYYLKDQGGKWSLEQIPYSHENASLRNFLKQSALLRYLNMNLQIAKKLQWPGQEPQTTSEKPDLSDRYSFLINQLCSTARKGRFKITILRNSSELTTKQFQKLSRSCPAVSIVDLVALQDQLKNQHPFIHLTHEPYDGHWNATMHHYVAEAIRPTLLF